MSVDVRRTAPPPGPDELREQWRRASLAGSWAYPGDWWCPAVDAVVESIRDGREPLAAAGELGRHRARSAVLLEEALDDLAALLSIAGDRGMPAALVREVTLGWADEMSCAQFAAACIDPLTGFATPAYLRTRLGEVYAEAQHQGADAGLRHALVVVDASGGGRIASLGATASMIPLRETLATVFPGGETVAATGPSLAVVLARRDDVLVPRHRTLRAVLDGSGAHLQRTWIERLPSTLRSARELVGDLGR